MNFISTLLLSSMLPFFTNSSYNNITISSSNEEISNIFEISELESNDNYDCATKIKFNIDNRTLVNGNLDYKMQFQDTDYYYFTLYTESVVSFNIKTTNNTNCLFDYALSSYDYYKVDSNFAYHLPVDIHYNYEGTNTIYFNEILNSGTYFIYLRGRQDKTIVDTINYVIDININKSDRVEYIYINDLIINKNNKSAIWISDLCPLKDNLLLNVNRDITYYSFYTNDNINVPINVNENFPIVLH